MHEWQQKANGNWVYPMGEDGVITVFRKGGDCWAGVYDDPFSLRDYGTAEEAMREMEKIAEGHLAMLQPWDTGWLTNKDGSGYHRRRAGRLASVKHASSGSWYVSINGSPLKGRWFKSAEEAKTAASRHLQADTQRLYSHDLFKLDEILGG